MTAPIIDVTGLDPREEAIKRVTDAMALGGAPVNPGQVRRILADIQPDSPAPTYYSNQILGELAHKRTQSGQGMPYAAAIAALNYEMLVRDAQAAGQNMPGFDPAQRDMGIRYAAEKVQDAEAVAASIPPAPPKPGLAGYMERYTVPMENSAKVLGAYGLTQLTAVGRAASGLGFHAGSTLFGGYITDMLFDDVVDNVRIMRGDTDSANRQWVEDWNNTAGRSEGEQNAVQWWMGGTTGSKALIIPGMAHMTLESGLNTIKGAGHLVMQTGRSIGGAADFMMTRTPLARTALGGSEWFVQTYRVGDAMKNATAPLVRIAESAKGFMGAAGEAIAAPAARMVAPLVEVAPWTARILPYASAGAKFITGAALGGIATVALGVTETGYGLATRNRETTGRGTATLIGSTVGGVIGILGGPPGIAAGVMLGGMIGSVAYDMPHMIEALDPEERSFLSPPLKATGNFIRNRVVLPVSDTLMDVTDKDPEKRRQGWRRVREGAVASVAMAIPGMGAVVAASQGTRQGRAALKVITTAGADAMETAGHAVADAGRRTARAADDVRDRAEDATIGTMPWDKWGKELREDVANLQRNYAKYSKLDTDHDGKIELHELRNALKRKGVDEIKDVDTNHDGKVSTQELMAKIAGVGLASPAAPAPASAPAGVPRRPTLTARS